MKFLQQKPKQEITRQEGPAIASVTRQMTEQVGSVNDHVSGNLWGDDDWYS
ncbi:unnamed protein product [Cuscuta epithymum]|uniref:Uncharacterized protein n=1 Tax=Cuscuta epithymum TaxID=186058 RepID=A0AAV0C4H9_9ASTE|nr:unnamed protein product [Cuscuta epithymum]